MEARIRQAALLAVVLFVSMGARRQTANFIIETSNPQFAEQVAQAAERFRKDLAVEWMGEPMPNWSQPCVMSVQVGPHLGAGGATTFIFDHGEVFGWRMSIQGSSERILDSVLPHEITHMVYASRFRQPLPRWADEGGATSVEHASEKNKHRTMLNEFLRTGRGIAFSKMFVMSEYPQDIMPLYAEGYSLAEFLIQTAGRRKYVEFLGDGLESENWPGAVQRHYGIKDLGVLQNTWLAWVRQGSPLLQPRNTTPALLASNERRPRPEPNLIYRVRDKQTPAEPAGRLVPVYIPSNNDDRSSAVVSTAAVRPASKSIKWLDPSPKTAARIAATDPRDSSSPSGERSGTIAVAALEASSPQKTLPASHWHVPGTPAEDANPSSSPSPSVEPPSVQVAHPQPMEQPRQTILR